MVIGIHLTMRNYGKNVFVGSTESDRISDYEKRLDIVSSFYQMLKDERIPCCAVYDEYFKKVHHIVVSNKYYGKLHKLAIACNWMA